MASELTIPSHDTACYKPCRLCQKPSAVDGNAHPIIQAEGGEQGDPLMPALYSLGQHSALQHTQQLLQAGERLYAYTWTTSTSSSPPTESKQHTTAHELQQHAHIQLNPAKTRVWNNSGEDLCGKGNWLLWVVVCYEGVEWLVRLGWSSGRVS